MPYPKPVDHSERSFPEARAIGGLIVHPMEGELLLAAGDNSVQARPKTLNQSAKHAIG